MTAAGLSSASVDRARRELEERGLYAELSVGDMRTCDRKGGGFDVVISADNAVPHLLLDQEILCAFQAMHRSLRPGGIALITVWDYTVEDRSTPQFRPYGLRSIPGGRCVVYQIWDFQADHYDEALYFVWERAGRS